MKTVFAGFLRPGGESNLVTLCGKGASYVSTDVGTCAEDEDNGSVGGHF